MGKGDQKTRRGKLFRGTYGVRRPRKRTKAFNVVSSTRRTREEKPAETRATKKKTGPPEKVKEAGQAAATPEQGKPVPEAATPEQGKPVPEAATPEKGKPETEAATPEQDKPVPEAATPEQEKKADQGTTEEKGDSV